MILGLSVFGLAACTDGPGDEADLVTALTRDDTFTTAEAECIASAVFAEYGTDDDAISKISGLGTYEELIGAEGVDGFDAFFTGAVRACTNT